MSAEGPSAAAVRACTSVLGERAVSPVPLGTRTTYRVGGEAWCGFELADDRDVPVVAQAIEASGLPVLVVGRGSNMLVADAGFPGLAVWLGPAFEAIDVDGTLVVAGGAVALPVLARHTVGEGLTGFEWAVGVPGAVGGAVRMNAGGHGSDIAATLRSADVADLTTGRIDTVAAADLNLSYRSSSVSSSQVVLRARFGLAEGIGDGEATLREIVRWRRANQPGGQNAGSVFVNPDGGSAGALIEELGLKGLRLGTAEVSAKHANFIQADPDGSADDVRRLIEEVAARVRRQRGIELHTEIRMIGFDASGTHGAGLGGAT